MSLDNETGRETGAGIAAGSPGDAVIVDEQELDAILRETGSVQQLANLGGSDPITARAPEQARPSQPRPKPTVIVSPDRMTVFLTLPAVAGGYSETEVQGELRAAGVVHGVNRPELSLLLAQGKAGQRIPVGFGTPPQPGIDSRIEYLFESGTPNLAEQGGRVDWREVNVVKSVDAGAPVARRVPSTPGTPGINVLGQAVPPKQPRDIRIPLGLGTAISNDDPNVVVATVAGAVRLDASGKVTVDNTYFVKGDVDLATGNVDFDGSIVVGNDVRSGFTLKASGDIEIKGLIEEAHLMAGGSIIAQGGVVGGSGGASLQAGHDVLARFANNATLVAGHDVVLGQEAVNCNIEAEGQVTVGGRIPSKGFIRGGTVRAAKTITAFTIGAGAGGKTELQVGYDWLLPRKLESVESELARRQEQLDRTRAGLFALLEERAAGELPTEKRVLLEKLRLATESLGSTIMALQNRRQTWLRVKDTKASISIHGKAHMGTQLIVDGCSRLLNEDRQGERFVAESGKVIGLSLKSTP